MKKSVFLTFLGIIFSLTAFSQITVSSNMGLNANNQKNMLVASSVSSFSDLNVMYQFKNFFVRSGLQLRAFTGPTLGYQIKEYTIPLYFGAFIKKNNFENLFGFGYTLSFPDKNAKYLTHSLGAFVEQRFYMSNKSYFTIGLNVNLHLKTSSSLLLYPNSSTALYIGYGIRFGK
jgi:hypothetical protein